MTEVITGLSPRWESVVATTLEQVRGVTVSRRCADVPELLAVAEAGVGGFAVVSADLRGLDLAVVGRLRARGLRVLGLHPAGDEAAERRLRQLSITLVLPVDAPTERFADALGDDPHGAADELALAVGLADPGAAPGADGRRPQGQADGHPDDPDDPDHPDGLGPDGPAAPAGWVPAGAPSLPPQQHPSEPDGAPVRARVIAVWGPAGAPGRTTLATTLASEVAARGTEVLLVDADTYGGCIAQALGLLDEAPGIAAACRAADQGQLDLPALARLAPEVTPGLRVLTGLPKAERWPEVRGGALERVLDLSRSLVPVVVVDCGFCLEDDEELSYDTTAPRRNEATLTTLACADVVVAVSGADPVALQRFVRGVQELGTVPSPPPVVVVNRVRASAVGARPQERIADSLRRFAGLDDVRFVPDDPTVTDGALLAGRSVVEHAPESPLRGAVADLADALLPATASRTARRSTGWRGRKVRV